MNWHVDDEEIPELNAEERKELRQLLKASNGTKMVVQAVKTLMVWIAGVVSGIAAIKYLLSAYIWK